MQYFMLLFVLSALADFYMILILSRCRTGIGALPYAAYIKLMQFEPNDVEVLV